MDPELDYLSALAEARSCLAALADQATDWRTSHYFDQLLIELDKAHPYGPATYPLAGDTVAILDHLLRALIATSTCAVG